MAERIGGIKGYVGKSIVEERFKRKYNTWL